VVETDSSPWCIESYEPRFDAHFGLIGEVVECGVVRLCHALSWIAAWCAGACWGSMAKLVSEGTLRLHTTSGGYSGDAICSKGKETVPLEDSTSHLGQGRSLATTEAVAQ